MSEEKDLVLRFDPLSHRYSFNGENIPSVTTILAEVLQTETRFFRPEHRIKGSRIHSLCSQIARLESSQDSEWDQTVPDFPDLAPFGRAFQRWFHETGFDLQWAETPIWSPTLMIAGTPDLLGKIGQRAAVVDIKSGQIPEYVGAQTCGYAKLATEHYGIKIEARFSLQLSANGERGEYRMRELNDSSDETVLLSCINVYRFKQAHGLLNGRGK